MCGPFCETIINAIFLKAFIRSLPDITEGGYTEKLKGMAVLQGVKKLIAEVEKLKRRI